MYLANYLFFDFCVSTDPATLFTVRLARSLSTSAIADRRTAFPIDVFTFACRSTWPAEFRTTTLLAGASLRAVSTASDFDEKLPEVVLPLVTSHLPELLDTLTFVDIEFLLQCLFNTLIVPATKCRRAYPNLIPRLCRHSWKLSDICGGRLNPRVCR